MKQLLLVGALIVSAGAVHAFERVQDRQDFVSLVEDRVLYLGLLNARLEVRPDGSITGTARGRDVTGNWAWRDGYFCREMDWSGRIISYNCQLVERDGARLRFISDRGAGQRATFQIR